MQKLKHFFFSFALEEREENRFPKKETWRGTDVSDFFSFRGEDFFFWRATNSQSECREGEERGREGTFLLLIV